MATIDQNRLQTDQSYRDQVRGQGYFVGSENGKVYAEQQGSGSSGGSNTYVGAATASPSTATGGLTNSNLDALTNAKNAATNAAQQAALQAYQQAQAQHLTDQLAFDKAVQAYKETYDAATAAESKREFDVTSGEKSREFDSSQALSALQTAAGLRGPANAFQQQAYLNGLNQQGYSKAIDAIAGRVQLPGVQAPQAGAQAASLGTLAGQVSGAAAVPTDAMLAALPNPNQIDPVAWNKLDPDSQAFIKSGYEAKGISGATIDNAVKLGQPQFRSPSFGLGLNV